MNYGYIKSELSSSDVTITPGMFPKQYMLKNLDPIKDQGAIPKCVSCVLTDMLNWKLKYEGKKIVRDSYFFDNRKDSSVQGMTPKDGFDQLSKGVKVSGVSYKSKAFSRLVSIEQIKYSIVSFGPVLIALPCYNETSQFWIGSGNPLGGHAVSLVGYDSEGFTIRNSWGYTWNSDGTTRISNNELRVMYEAWTLIN